jgi:hypothetical protein
LVEEGLTFSDCVHAFANRRSEDELAYVQAACKKQEEGSLEVDETAIVSKGDENGAYVMSWLWVENSDIRRSSHPNPSRQDAGETT